MAAVLIGGNGLRRPFYAPCQLSLEFRLKIAPRAGSDYAGWRSFHFCSERNMTTSPAAPRSSSRTARFLIVVLLLFIVVTFALWMGGALQPRPRLALVTAGSSGNYWDMIIRGAKDAAARYDVGLDVITPKSDEPSQTAAIQALVGTHLDGVAISPNDPPRQAAALADIAQDTQGNLITFDSDSPVSRRLCFIGTDNYDAGRVCAEYVKQAIPSGGDVIIAIGSLDKENGQRRRQGVIDGLLERSMERQRPMDPVDGVLKDEKHPNYTIIATLVDGIDPAKATELASDALKKNPNAKCFVGLFAYSTPAILKALGDNGKLGQIKVVGFDANDETLAAIDAGNVQASVVQDAYAIGFQAIRVLADVTKGDKRFATPMFPTVYLSADPVTKANVDQVRHDMEARRSGKALQAGTGSAPTTQATTGPT
jgi:ribose transport system substrate-binding protein